MPSPMRKLDGVVTITDAGTTFDPTKIVIENGHNPRTPDALRANVERLKPLIVAAGGVMQQIWVRKDGERIILVDGESRLTAVMELIASGAMEIPSVPIKLLSGMADEAARLIEAMRANTGEPLAKWEHGATFNRLQRIGWHDGQIAKQLGFTERYVYEARLLADTPVEMRNMLSAGSVSQGAALAAIKTVGPSQALADIKAASVAAGGAPVKRQKARNNATIIAICERMLESCMADPEAPGMYTTVHKGDIDDLREALKVGA